MGRLVRVVLDTIKPIRGPTLPEVAKELADAKGVKRVNIKVDEVDVETITMTIVVEGDDIDFEDLRKRMEELGVIIHSIDEAVGEA